MANKPLTSVTSISDDGSATSAASVNSVDSTTNTTHFNPNLNTPGTQNTAPTPSTQNGNIAPSQISESVGYFKEALMSDFTNKTFYQDAFVLSNPTMDEFCSQFPSEPEIIAGKYKEYSIIMPLIGAKFSKEAFQLNATPSENQVNGSVRRDVHNLGTNKFRVALVDADNDANKIMKYLTITKPLYTEKFNSGKLDEFVSLAAGQLNVSLKTEIQNKQVLGYEAIVEGANRAMNGLAQLVDKCKADTQVGVNDQYLTRNVVYKKSSSTGNDNKAEAISQLNQLLFKMASPNQTFAFFNEPQTGAAANSGMPTVLADKVIVMHNEMAEALKASELDYFKKFSELFPSVKVYIIPNTTFDTSYVANASSLVAPIKDININLAKDEILIYDKSKGYYLSSEVVDIDSQYTPTNQTVTNYAFARPTFGILPNASVAVFKAPVLLEQYGVVVVNP